MLIIGAKGFAKEVLELFHERDELANLAFYDDINKTNLLYGKFKVLNNEDEVKVHFQKFGNEFTIGLGNPFLRNKLYKKFSALGGICTTVISSSAKIGSYDVNIGHGTNILAGAIFSNSTKIGIAGIVYYNVAITHDCCIGDFVELSPNVQLLGRCKIGNFTQIGAGSIVLPDIEIGDNVIIGAGSVITRSIPSNSVAVGTPARVIKQIKPLGE